MDEAETWRGRLIQFVALPAGLLLLVPLALLFAVWFYLSATVHGVRVVAGALFWKQRAVSPLQKPHFAETRSGVPHHHDL